MNISTILTETVEQAKTSMKSDMKIENFKITGDFIIEGGAKSKFKANSKLSER